MRYLLIDHITGIEPGKSIKGVKNVAMSEDFLEFHFPRNPIMPGVLQLEAMVQLAGWLAAADSDFAEWALVSRVGKCNFYRFALPGDTVQVQVELIGPAEDDEGANQYRGICSSGGKKLVKAEFTARTIALTEIEDVSQQRHHFKVLRRELKP